jgi:hypothetical protein
MAWIASHNTLAHHPKTRRLARLLGVSIPQAIGHLHLLWWWCVDFAPDGDLTGYTADDLADAALWDGDPDHFLQALLTCAPTGRQGFLEQDPDGRLRLHDWADYAAPWIQQRAQRTQASAKANHERWHVRRGQVDATCAWCTPAPSTDSTDTPRPPRDDSDPTPSGVRTESERSPNGLSTESLHNIRGQENTEQDITTQDTTAPEDPSPPPNGGATEEGPPAREPADLTPTERAILHTWRGIPGYPFDWTRDVAFVRALQVDFPTVDLAEEARRWATYKLDKPLRAHQNPRLQFRHWVQNAERFKTTPRAGPGPPRERSDEPRAWAVLRRSLLGQASAAPRREDPS